VSRRARRSTWPRRTCASTAESSARAWRRPTPSDTSPNWRRPRALEAVVVDRRPWSRSAPSSRRAAGPTGRSTAGHAAGDRGRWLFTCRARTRRPGGLPPDARAGRPRRPPALPARRVGLPERRTIRCCWRPRDRPTSMRGCARLSSAGGAALARPPLSPAPPPRSRSRRPAGRTSRASAPTLPSDLRGGRRGARLAAPRALAAGRGRARRRRARPRWVGPALRLLAAPAGPGGPAAARPGITRGGCRGTYRIVRRRFAPETLRVRAASPAGAAAGVLALRPPALASGDSTLAGPPAQRLLAGAGQPYAGRPSSSSGAGGTRSVPERPESWLPSGSRGQPRGAARGATASASGWRAYRGRSARGPAPRRPATRTPGPAAVTRRWRPGAGAPR